MVYGRYYSGPKDHVKISILATIWFLESPVVLDLRPRKEDGSLAMLTVYLSGGLQKSTPFPSTSYQPTSSPKQFQDVPEGSVARHDWMEKEAQQKKKSAQLLGAGLSRDHLPPVGRVGAERLRQQRSGPRVGSDSWPPTAYTPPNLKSGSFIDCCPL